MGVLAEERGREGDQAARGGGVVSARWMWSGQVEECVRTPAASPGIDGVAHRITCQNRKTNHREYLFILVSLLLEPSLSVLFYC